MRNFPLDAGMRSVRNTAATALFHLSGGADGTFTDNAVTPLARRAAHLRFARSNDGGREILNIQFTHSRKMPYPDVVF
eukprot:6212618-Pleurochrysis_carterae.AAC.3